MGKKIKWTDEHIKFIKKHQYHISRKELLSKLKAAFNDIDPEATNENFKGLIARLGLINKFSGLKKKGDKPWNDGKTGYMGANKTSFKKGTIPHNHRPVGSERTTIDGYLEVKTAEPRTWELKHRIVWVENKGKIPNGHCIRFLDNDKSNCDISNLILVPRTAHAVINKRNKADTASPELNKAIILTETLKQKTRMAT